MPLRVSNNEAGTYDEQLTIEPCQHYQQMTSRTRLKRKEVDDVLGGAEAWAHADKTQGTLSFSYMSFLWRWLTSPLASCDKCNFNEAYFYQLQIRSADEPMTTCMTFSLYLLWLRHVAHPSTVYRYMFCNINTVFISSSCRCAKCAHQWRENWFIWVVQRGRLATSASKSQRSGAADPATIEYWRIASLMPQQHESYVTCFDDITNPLRFQWSWKMSSKEISRKPVDPPRGIYTIHAHSVLVFEISIYLSLIYEGRWAEHRN